MNTETKNWNLSDYEKKPGVYFINNVICYGVDSAINELKKINDNNKQLNYNNNIQKRKTGTKIYGA